MGLYYKSTFFRLEKSGSANLDFFLVREKWLTRKKLCSKLGHANTAVEVAVRNCNELNWFYAEEFFAEFFIDAALEQKV